MEIETLSWINAIAAISSAIGTIAAVIVALYLARRDEMLRLRASVARGDVISKIDSRSVVMINISNIGRRPVQITSLGWRIGFAKKRHYFLKLDENDPDNHPLPNKLGDGDQAHYFISAPDFDRLMDEIIDGLSWMQRNFVARSMRFLIHTSAGKVFVVKPAKDLRTHVMKLSSSTKNKADAVKAA